MCEVTGWQTLLLALWGILEFWLGKTDKVQAGSTLEVVLNLVRGFLKRLPTSTGEK